MTFPVVPQPSRDSASTSLEGIWLVKTRRGVLSLSLDELDEAFQRGDVDASTRVFTSGMMAWDTLGHVANLDEPGAVGATATERVANDQTSQMVLERLDAGAPTTTGVFGTSALPWASIKEPEAAEADAYTMVRRNSGFVHNPLRRAALELAKAAARLRRSHPRLGVAAPWLFGATLSGVFVLALYQFGATSEPAPTGKSSLSSVRAAVNPAPSAGAHALGRSSITSSASAEAVATTSPRATTSPSQTPEPGASDDVATVRASELRPVAAERAETSRATAVLGDEGRPARATSAKAMKAGKKSKHRRSAKAARKRRAAALE